MNSKHLLTNPLASLSLAWLLLLPFSASSLLTLNAEPESASEGTISAPLTLVIHGAHTAKIPSTSSYFAAVLDQDTNLISEQEVIWSLSSEVAGVRIDSQTGKLQVNDSVSAQTVNLVAALADNDSIRDVQTVVLADADITEIKIIGPHAVPLENEVNFTALVRNDLTPFDWHRSELVRWTLEGRATKGVTLDPQSGLLKVGTRALDGGNLIVRATLLSNDSVYAEQKVRLGDRLNTSLREESSIHSALLDKEIVMRVYHRDGNPPAGGVRHGILYVYNTAAPRIGTESDLSIVNDYLERGWSVITLDYGNDQRAVSPELEKELHSFFNPKAHNRVDRRLKSDFFSDAKAYRPARTYILPAGYRVRNDVPYFKLSSHGPFGILDKMMRDWNTKIASVTDGIEPVFKPEDMKMKNGEALEMNYVMDVIYPSRPKEAVPILVRFATDLPKDPNSGNSGKLWHFTGFTLRGGAYATVGHPYDVLYFDHWKAVGAHSYTHVDYVGLASGQAALRQLNEYAWLYGIDSQHIFGSGLSKGQYFVTRMLNPNHESQTELKILEDYPQGSPEPQPYANQPAHMAAGYQSAGLGIFLHNRKDHAGNAILSQGYLPTLVAVGLEDPSPVIEPYYKFVKKLKNLGVTNYVDLAMPNVAHELPNGWNHEKGADNYQIYIDFFEAHRAKQHQ